MEQVENRMVVDSEWRFLENNTISKVVQKKGYHKVGESEFVPDDEAFEYAFDRCINGTEEDVKEFRTMLVEWYFSGGAWRREE